MKIVFIITRLDDLGGAQFHIRDLSTALIRSGHEVIVLGGGTGPFTEVLESQGIPYRILPSLVRPIKLTKDIGALREIYLAIKTLSPDLVATHSSKAGWLGRLAGYALGIPTVFTAHGWAFTEGVPQLKQFVYAWAERLAAGLAAKIITVSNFDRNLALRKKVAKETKLITVHNGVPDIPLTQVARPGNQPPELIMVARFSQPKDHNALLQAMAGLTHLPWQINLVGDGPLLPQAKETAAILGIDSRVNFLGACKNVPELLARSQIFVLVSKWEGFPLSVLEAMRAGLPVVVSDVGGAGEALRDGEDGFLVPRGDQVTLQDRLGRLIADSALRQKMGEQSRQKFVNSFTVDEMLEKTLVVYHQAIGR